MTNPTVSIIIITRNRPFLLRHAIQHVLAQPYPHKELIVVDSSSNDESEQVVREYPEVIRVRLYGQRNNMPQARNEGMAVSSGNVIAFVDDDAMVEPGWLDALIDTYRDETVGAVGGRVIAVPKPHCDLSTGTPSLSIRRSGRIISKNVGAASTDQVDVDWVSGCNMSFRRAVLEEVGGFDPAYTLTNWCEETDLCMRVKKASWRIVFNPAMAVIHFSPRSSSRHFLKRPLNYFSTSRNNAYFAIKHFGLNPYTLAWQLILAPAKTYGQVVLQTVIHSIAAVAQNVGRLFGLVAGIRWLASSRRQVRSAPKIWQAKQFSTIQPSCTAFNRKAGKIYSTRIRVQQLEESSADHQ